ncbi:MAG: carbohydrate-binding domain-containing protein, partial [Rikenellaceae bacterium]|nr:carbohydrate-binding domain-containing protein [Rikenellaceae bacterium]
MKTTKFPTLLIIGIFIAFGLALASCTDTDDNHIDPDNELTTGAEEPEIPEDTGDPGDEELVPNTQIVSYDNAVTIVFDEGSVEIGNPYQADGITVTAEGQHVVITSTDTSTEYNYILSGITTDGSVKIYGDYKFGLVFNGVGITNPNGAAVNIQCGKKVSVILQDGTTNRLIDGTNYIYYGDEDMKGTFFSEGQLVFDGGGTLEVRGKNKHGICSDDYVRINSGTVWVKEAASDAIHANDYIRIDGGTVTTRSEGEGLECEKGYVVINGGELGIVTTGEKGHGIKSKTYTTVTGGTVNITVYGDASKAFNVKEDFTMTAGSLDLAAAGDAIWDDDANDTSSCA